MTKEIRPAALNALDDVLGAAQQLHGQGPAVIVLHGPPGIGKSTLAEAAADRLVQQYPETKRLTLRLGSMLPGDRSRFLQLRRELENSVQEPTWDLTQDALEDSYRMRTRGRRTVLVLHDIGYWEEVEALLPSGDASLVIATSLTPCPVDLGHSITHNHEVVERPDRKEGYEIFRRAAARPVPGGGDLDDVISACLHQPLAIELAGAAYGVGMGLPELAATLRKMGGTAADITRAAFTLGYRDLSPEQQRLLRLLSVPTAPTVDVLIAATLLDQNATVPDEMRRHRVQGLLDALVRRRLLRQASKGRYRLDLSVRYFAAEELSLMAQGSSEAEDSRFAAGQRLLEGYGRLTAQLQPLIDGSLKTYAPFPSADRALNWFRDELDAILSALQYAAATDPLLTGDLIRLLCDYFTLQGDLNALGIIEYMLGGLKNVDHSVRREVDLGLGIAARRAGRLKDSVERLERVRESFIASHDPEGEAWALRQIGVTLHHQGRLTEATTRLEEARKLLGRHDLRHRKAWVLQVLGAVYCDRGMFNESAELLHKSIELHELHGNPRGKAWAQLLLASSWLRQGNLRHSRDLLEEACKGFEVTQDGPGQGWCLMQQARSQLLGHDALEALSLLDRAQDRHLRYGDRQGVAWTAFIRARCHQALGDVPAWRRELMEAADVFEEIGNGLGEAWAWLVSASLPDCDTKARRVGEARELFARYGDEVGVKRSEAELSRSGSESQPGLRTPTAGGLAESNRRPPEPGDHAADPLVPSPTELDDIDSKSINFWIAEGDTPLRVGSMYAGCFQVGPVMPSNLAGGSQPIPAGDIPPAGLVTRWIVWSTTVRLSADDTDPTDAPVTVDTVAAGDHEQWTCTFDLAIPAHGASDTVRMQLVPLTENGPKLQVMVFAGDDIYREVTIHLSVDDGGRNRAPETDDAALPVPPAAEPASLIHRAEVNQASAARALNPAPEQTWQAADTTLTLNILGNTVMYNWTTTGEWKPEFSDHDGEAWEPDLPKVRGHIKYVHSALERFRSRYSDELNAVSVDDLRERLVRFSPGHSWREPVNSAPEQVLEAWRGIETSRELASLAYHGRQLFGALFPRGTKVREQIDRLEPGDALRVYWYRNGQDLPHLPWALLYKDQRAPSSLENDRWTDPRGFLGLRQRIAHLAYRTSRNRVLGGSTEGRAGTHAHLLYWGGRSDDVTAETAREHRQAVRHWGPRVLPTGDQRRKEQVCDFLANPDPDVTLLYLYCKANQVSGHPPGLRFGSTNPAEDVIDLEEIGTREFTGNPLVFLNACDTSIADPVYRNEFEDLFFDRKCQAYIGTECKVPVQFAARFATAFFHFLCAMEGSNAMTAGEAAAQARKFFWDEYRNLGGLFYSYLNDDRINLATRRPQ
ncbi:tetratricopeptide repeat protein [Streptomyces sp. NBC_01381]|uniref:tetratricopeptide repeat protein n=1 Tax=Streptomyces sp. NBC_01381 TaxID=2903845 RepID=UPI002259F4A7|nr:tetratricopeptide repeat protein [Streptomyces sp. NBC_01381]MCX4672346.1 tetratricopeptide repeat protein [Streptomyces sp. NBC_01381]